MFAEKGLEDPNNNNKCVSAGKPSNKEKTKMFVIITDIGLSFKNRI